MSSSRGRGKGKLRVSYSPLRKPGDTVKPHTVQDEEKPEATVQREQSTSGRTGAKEMQNQKNELDTAGQNDKEISNSTENKMNTYDILVKAVNKPAFVPKHSTETASSWSSLSASAVHAPEFVPGKPFIYVETPAERIQSIEHFVCHKMQQVLDDPGLLEEISSLMAEYLSVYIKTEQDLEKLSDLLFDKCVSEPNFPYAGSRLANHLDKNLNFKGLLPSITFRSVFLKRCREENYKFNELMESNPQKASTVAIFFGELLMNYKTVGGDSINKLCDVVSNTTKSLLASNNRELLICAGKLLKLTGRLLDQSQEELFERVTQLAVDPSVDRTARILFKRVCDLRSTNWGQNELLQTDSGGAVRQETPLFIPDMSNSLEEQVANHPVSIEEEWNDFAVDDEEDTGGEAALYRQVYYEQYGFHYPAFATADDSNSVAPLEEDYYEDYESFLQSNNSRGSTMQ